MPPSCLSRACVLRLSAPPRPSSVAPVPPPRSAVYLRLFFVARCGHDGLGARFQPSISQSRDCSLRPTAFGRLENDKAKGRRRGKSRVVLSETAANPLSARHSCSSGKIHEASAAVGHMAPRAGALVDAQCEPSSPPSTKLPPAALEVAVIGAGAAGLVAARELRREGHRVTVFEQGERGVGGVWRYDSTTEDDPLGTREGRREVHGSMYASLRTNLPREVMGFTDFPFSYPLPGEDPTYAPGAAAAATGAGAGGGGGGGGAAAVAAAATSAAAGAAGAAGVYSDEMLADSRRFPRHTEVLRYLERFSQHYGLVDCIRFGAKVVDVRAVGESKVAAEAVAVAVAAEAAAAAASQDEESTGTSSSSIVRKGTTVDTIDAAAAPPTGAWVVANGVHEGEGGRQAHADGVAGWLLATVQDQQGGSGVHEAEGTRQQGKQEAREEAVSGGGGEATVGRWRPRMRVSWVQRRRDSSSCDRSSSASDGSATSHPSSHAPPPLAPLDVATVAEAQVALSRSECRDAVSAAATLPPSDEGSAGTDGDKDTLTESQVFDAVVVCNGHYSRPRIAHIPGLEEWPGFQLHSHNYREPSSFAGKVVAVVGAGASGDDLSREIARVAKAVHMCSRGWTDDANVPTRDESAWPNLWYHPMVVRAHADGTLEYADGERVHTHVLMHCTGYHYHFPFLRSLSDAVRVEGNRVGPLYRHVFPPHLAPSLSFVGLPWKVVPFPLCEMQAKWVAKALTAMCGCTRAHGSQPAAQGRSGQSAEVEEAAADEFLPSVAEMEAEAHRLYDKLEEAGIPLEYTHRFDLKGVPGTDQFEYVDWLAQQCGCPPLPTWRRAMYAASSQRKRRCPETYRDKWEDEAEVEAAASEFARAAVAVGASANLGAVQIGLS